MKNSLTSNHLPIKLFDVAACKYHIFDSCKCKKDQTVPKEERPFLNDQCRSRKMVIGGIDPKITGRQVNKFARNVRDKKSTCLDKQLQREMSGNSAPIQHFESKMHLYNESADNVRDPSFVGPKKKNGASKCNTKAMNNLAVACDRTGVSSRSAAILTNAVLEDVGYINPSNSIDVADRNKITRQRKTARSAHKERTVEALKIIIQLDYTSSKLDLLSTPWKYTKFTSRGGAVQNCFLSYI